MPSLTAVIASGLGALLVVPVLAIAGAGGGGATCLPDPTTSGTALPATQLVQHVISVGTQAIPAMPRHCENVCPQGAGDPAQPVGPSSCPDGPAVLARAATWLTAWNGGPVPYSMNTDPAASFAGYRRDCSGYASMALGLPEPGLNTTALAARATPIPKTDLRPGDLLINPTPGGAGHVAIFESWTSPGMDAYLGYEQSGDGGTHHRVIQYPSPGDHPMSPCRPGAR